MNRKELRERVETALQDPTNKHWSDVEINRYINDALVEFVKVVKQPQLTGYATNPGGTTALGETGLTGATLTVDGKTAKITHSSAHGLSDDDVVFVSGAEPSQFNGGHNVKKLDNNNFTYQVPREASVTDATVDFFRVGPLFTKPSTIDEIVSVSIDGRELSIYTESELNQQAGSRQNRHFMLESSMGFHPNAFSVAVTTTDNTPRWRDQQGPIEAVVFNNRTSSTFRIYPLPKDNKDLYVDEKASTKVFHQFLVRGVPKITPMATDSATPVIHPYYHEGLVYGALERAWLKEGQAQNLEKAQIYNAKFQGIMADALRMEGLAGGSLNEGVNSGSMRINRFL